jgi:cyclophilin family peptidyl-prolyl cis-trans isomerase
VDASGEASTSVTIGDPSQALPADNDYGDTMPHPTVTLSTTLGDIRIELFPEDAPLSVANFLGYVESGYYDGLIFHRVIPGFVVQAGGHGPDMALKQTTQPQVTNESDNGLRNLRGTLSMARMPKPHTATSQFFISLQDNANLDHSGGPEGWGYAVFGRVIEGMDVVDLIATKPRGSTEAGPRDVPLEAIVIVSARRGADIEPVAAGD